MRSGCGLALNLSPQLLPAFAVPIIIAPKVLQAAYKKLDLLGGEFVAGGLLGPLKEVLQRREVGILRSAFHCAFETMISAAADGEAQPTT